MSDEPINEPSVQDLSDVGTPPDYDMRDPVAPSPGTPDTGKTQNKYSYVDPKNEVPADLLSKALDYYDTNLTKIKNKDYLSVINFSSKSTKPRFFIINMRTGSVWAVRMAHGKGSDSDHDGYAEKFSNVSGSNASSLGYYMTAETYVGSHGTSLRLDGLSSTNSNARSRAVVIHGATYVQDSDVIQGRSWGCPAISMDNYKEVIGRIKGGSLIYAGLTK